MCTKNRIHHFGDIVDGEMMYHAIGAEVRRQWLDTPTLRPDMNLTLDAFQVITTFARQNNLQFDWLPKYHEHLIRDAEELVKIRYYIQNNLINWELDELNK